MKLIIGLGNPEDKYSATRHNLGFEVLDELRRKLNTPEWSLEKKFKAEISKLGDELILIRPQTYMNQSGLAVASLKRFFKIDSKDIIVVHDELDLLLGHLKVRLGGGAGGHHGIENIIEQLGTDQFIRVRLGIGNDKSFSGEHKRISFNAEHFVLEPFLNNETSKVRSTVKKAIKAIDVILDKGVDKAQNQFN
jgi:peptidyl-tRNA hydrolase, PTH1 family